MIIVEYVFPYFVSTSGMSDFWAPLVEPKPYVFLYKICQLGTLKERSVTILTWMVLLLNNWVIGRGKLELSFVY